MARRKTTEEIRIEALLNGLERKNREKLKALIARVKGDLNLKQIGDLIQGGRLTEAMNLIDQLVAPIGEIATDTIMQAGNFERKKLQREFKNAAVGVSFDPTNPRAAATIRNYKLDLIREITASQREAIRQAVLNGLNEGLGPRQVATAFKNSIGLTARQEASVRNYKRLLSGDSSDLQEALSRELRDRRFDRTVSRSASTNVPLTPAQIAKMTERYRQQMLNYRAEMIARTETTRAVSIARDEAFRQTMDEIGIDPSRVERTWRATTDSRTRDTHGSMNGQKVGLDEPFKSPSGALLRYPGDYQAPASETIHCRCSVTTRLARRQPTLNPGNPNRTIDVAPPVSPPLPKIPEAKPEAPPLVTTVPVNSTVVPNGPISVFDLPLLGEKNPTALSVFTGEDFKFPDYKTFDHSVIKTQTDAERFINRARIADQVIMNGMNIKEMGPLFRAAHEVVNRFDTGSIEGMGPISQFAQYRQKSDGTAIAAIHQFRVRTNGKMEALFNTPRSKIGRPKLFSEYRGAETRSAEKKFTTAYEMMDGTPAKPGQRFAVKPFPNLDPRVREIMDRLKAIPTSDRRYSFSIPGTAKSSDDMLRDVTYHEMGHVLHLTNASKSELRDAINKHILEDRPVAGGWQLPLSEYAMTNSKEYVAESFALYMSDPNLHWRLNPRLLEIFKQFDKEATQ